MASSPVYPPDSPIVVDPSDPSDPSELTVGQKAAMFEVYVSLHTARERVMALEAETMQLRADLKQAHRHRDALQKEALMCVDAPVSRPRPVSPWTASHVVAVALLSGVAYALALWAVLARLDEYSTRPCPCVCSCVSQAQLPMGDGGGSGSAWPALRTWVTVGLGRLMAIVSGGGDAAHPALES